MAQNRDFEADGLRFSINPDGKSVTLSGLINKNTPKVVIPSTVNNYPVTSIGHEAFYVCYECTGLTSVTIPDSVTKIGEGAFYGCSGLTSVTIGNSVTAIGDEAFYGCSGLTSVIIPDTVMSIGDGAFSDCTGLTCIEIPDSVTKIEGRTFGDCTGLTSVTIPDSVTAIGDEAFSDCTGLTSVTIPDSVTRIDYSAFRKCTGLTSVTIPDSVTTIGDDAFVSTAWFDNQPDGLVYAGLVAYKYKGRMPSGTSIVLKEGTKSISGYAFYRCTGLTSVTIPNSVMHIGYKAFENCTGLTSVTIGNSVTSIGDWAFDGCSGLKCLTIPNSVKEIGYNAFFGCSDLKQIILTGFGHNSKVLPEEIQKQIEILRIGSGISEIGNLRCNPKEIWCYAEVPPRCSEGVFTGFDAVLHVPERAAAAYFEADVWRNFTNIVFDADEN